MSHALHIRLLGAFTIERNGVALPDAAWRSRQERRLLGILLSARGRFVSTDELTRWLWPETEPATAAVSLRSAISSLRRTLEPDGGGRASSHYIVTRQGGYAWNATSDAWIDVEEFLQRTEDEGRMTSASPQSSVAVGPSSLVNMERAVALYRGDYLEDEPDAPWADAERTRLRQRYLDVLDRLARARIAQGDTRAAIQLVERGLARDPLCEPLYRTLMLAQVRAGDTAGALRTFERCRRAIDEALGALPSPQTRDLHTAILRGEETGGKGQGAGVRDRENEECRSAGVQETNVREQPISPSPHLPIFSSPLVGRAHELEQLRGWIDAWVRGRGGIVLIGGEAGIGKTRLAEEARRMALKHDALAITLRATPLEQALPFSSLSEALRPLLRNAPDDDLRQLPAAALTQVADLLPVLRERLPNLPELPPVPPAERHNRLLDGLVDLAQALARKQPLLIICDDAHWADEATLAAVGRLARYASNRALLLVLTYRAEELAENQALHALLRTLGRDMLLRPLFLSRLNRAEITQFLARLARSDPERTVQLAAQLLTRTGGNPLFLNVAVQALVEAHGAPSLAALLPQLGDFPSLPDLMGKPQIRDLVLGRFERLPEAARTLLEQVAVVGRPVSLDLIEQLGGATALDDAQLLIQRQFLVEDAEGRLAFNHDLVRSIIVAGLSLPQSRKLHRQVAQAIALLHSDNQARAAEIAAHFKQAGHGTEREVLHFSTLAGDEARRAFGYRQALQQYGAALQAAMRLGEAAPADTVQRAFTGQALTHEALLDWDGILHTAQMHEHWSASRDQPAAPLVTTRHKVLLRALMGDLAGAAAISVADAAQRQGDTRMHHPALDDMLRRTALILQPSAAPPADTTTFTPAPPPPGAPADELPTLLGPDDAALALFQIGWAALTQGLVRAAQPCLLRAHQLGIETGQGAAAVISALQLAHLNALRGDTHARDQWLTQSLGLALKASEAAWAAIWPRIHQGFVWWLDDRFVAAQARFEEMDAQLAMLPSFEAHRASVTAGLGLLALARGERDSARQLLASALGSPHLHGFVYVTAQHGLARLAALDGDAGLARDMLQQMLAYTVARCLLPEYVRTVVEIARFERDFGDPAPVLAHLAAAARLAEEADLGALAAAARTLHAKLRAAWPPSGV